MNCFSCGKDIPPTIQRGDECEHCGSDLKVCLNCQFYDRNVYNECRENSADVVREKDRANFCDYFTVKTGPQSTSTYNSEALKATAQRLFNNKKTKPPN